MTFTKDVFFRSHVVELTKGTRSISSYNEPAWTEHLLLYDTETRTDAEQALTFGMYRVCRLNGEGNYECVEEGIVHAENLSASELQVIQDYTRFHRSEVISDVYDERLHVYPRTDFVEKVFWEAVRNKSFVCAFNAPFDISRLSVGYKLSRNRGFTLILSQRTSRKTGELESNPDRPCVRVTSKDSKAAFFSLTKPVNPEEWPYYEIRREGDEKPHFCHCGDSATHRAADSAFLCAKHAKLIKERGQKVTPIKKLRLIFRVLDLRTLGWALFNESRGLDGWCDHFKIQGKDPHKLSGQVTLNEIDYCRQDVRCSVNVLNLLKAEFDKHPAELALHPDKVVSPASIGKTYLKAMGIIPPKLKFNVTDEILGVAAQPFHGGRAEVRIRETPVPVVLTDFSSQYPLVQSLLRNQDVFTAENVTFEDATQDVRKLLENITLDDCFTPEEWKYFSFFTLVTPDNDILPVRAEYDGDGVTKNIGINYFTSETPMWYSGPDAIASKILTGKAPRIERAIRMVPHGQQAGLKSVSLRGMVDIDPRKDDIFRVMVEQKQLYKESDEALSYFLKICANATSYGIWFEVTPKRLVKITKIKVFSGEHSHEQFTKNVERHGEWYFPPLASLITGGAHLLQAMIEKCIADENAQHLFMDTDSVCIVASRRGSTLKRMKDLSWKDVEQIAKRFEKLNIYNKRLYKVLKIEKLNFDKKTGKQRELFGYAISTKRYVLYSYDSCNNVLVQEAKAHGLGYLYPPKDDPEEDEQEQDWIKEIWYWILQCVGIVRPGPPPKWSKFPAMMRVAITTPAVFSMVKKRFVKPFNFVFMPQVLCKPGDEARHFTLIMPYSTDRESWLKTKAFDVRDGKEHSIILLSVGEKEPEEIEVASYGNVTSTYMEHPEAKFLDSDGEPCDTTTCGVLIRSHIAMDSPRWIGKETSRHWEQGDDISMVDFVCAEFNEGKVRATEEQRAQITKTGIRKVERATGTDHKTILLITRGEFVKPRTLRTIVTFLEEQKRKQNEPDPFSADKISDLAGLKQLGDMLDPKKNKENIAMLNERIRRLEELKR